MLDVVVRVVGLPLITKPPTAADSTPPGATLKNSRQYRQRTCDSLSDKVAVAEHELAILATESRRL